MPVPEKIRKQNKLVNERNVIKYMVGQFPTQNGESIDVFLHEAEWVLHNGCIPKGKLVSHADGDPMNNELSNLTLVDENTEHGDLHDNKIFHEDTLDLDFIKKHFPDIHANLIRKSS